MCSSFSVRIFIPCFFILNALEHILNALELFHCRLRKRQKRREQKKAIKILIMSPWNRMINDCNEIRTGLMMA